MLCGPFAKSHLINGLYDGARKMEMRPTKQTHYITI